MLYNLLELKHTQLLKAYVQNPCPSLVQGAHFVENHDQGHSRQTFGNSSVGNAAAIIAITLPGIRFSYLGQWVGRFWNSVVQVPRLASV